MVNFTKLTGQGVRGYEPYKWVMVDVQADHDSCKEYERNALEAQKKGAEALEWIHQRYVAKARLPYTRLPRHRSRFFETPLVSPLTTPR